MSGIRDRKGFTVVMHSSGPQGGFVVRTVWDDGGAGSIAWPYGQAERHGMFETEADAQRHADQMNEMGACIDCGKPLSVYDLDSTDPNRCDSCETQARYDRDATEQGADVLPDVPEYVVGEATEEFFGAVARHYPTITTGDFPPDADHAFHLAATRAIKVWVAFNTEPEEEPVKTEADFVNRDALHAMSDAELLRTIETAGPAAVVDAARQILAVRVAERAPEIRQEVATFARLVDEAGSWVGGDTQVGMNSLLAAAQRMAAFARQHGALEPGAGDASQPSVYLVMTSSGVPVSACAFEDTGEVLETVEFHPDGAPRWDGASIADVRGGGSEAGFLALHRSLLEAEANAKSILGEAPKRVPSARKVQDEPLDDAPRAGAPIVMSQGEIADHLEILADLDEGENVDDEALRATAAALRADQPQHDLGVEVGDRVILRHPVDRYPHFIAPAGALGTVVDAQADAISVKMDDHIPGAEEWSNDVVWSPSNGDSILRDVVVLSQRARLVSEIESRIVEVLHSHEEGRSEEPTMLDFVQIGAAVLRAHYPGFPGTTPEGERFNADVLEDRKNDPGISSVLEVAEYIYQSLTEV